MAKHVNNVSYTKAALEFQEDGEILVHEITKDGYETFSLTDKLKEFESDDLSRLINITIKEDVILEGTTE